MTKRERKREEERERGERRETPFALEAVLLDPLGLEVLSVCV